MASIREAVTPRRVAFHSSAALATAAAIGLGRSAYRIATQDLASADDT